VRQQLDIYRVGVTEARRVVMRKGLLEGRAELAISEVLRH
jgi:hypothetical protein